MQGDREMPYDTEQSHRMACANLEGKTCLSSEVQIIKSFIGVREKIPEETIVMKIFLEVIS